jgi:lysozyme
MIEGIDVSMYNGVIDWKKVVGSGKRFVYVRIGISTSFDKVHDLYIKDAQTVGLDVGAYWFADPSNDAGIQARMMSNHGGNLILPPTLDLETYAKQSPTTVLDWAEDFIRELECSSKRRIVVYAGKYFYEELRKSNRISTLTSRCLWHPQYTMANKPDISSAWSNWTIWQYRGDVFKDDDGNIIVPAGKCAGIGTAVDLDVFNGTEQEYVDWRDTMSHVSDLAMF